MKDVMDVVRISAKLNREEQLSVTGRRRIWHKVMEPEKRRMLKRIQEKEVKEDLEGR